MKKGNKELDKIASEFISFVAHQMKSPLVAIKGYADLLAGDQYGKIPAEAKAVILKIRAASQRSLDLAENLLDLKRIEEGKMKYNFETLDLNKLIQDVCDELQTLAEKKKLKLEFQLAENAKAYGDKQTLHQVIQNLVDNAIKYTDKGFVRIEIEEKGKNKIIKVSDSGRGMSKEILGVAFDKFTREAKVHQIISGTGLGLFIAKNIIDDHGGRIWAESEGEGKGSQFYISIKSL